MFLVDAITILARKFGLLVLAILKLSCVRTIGAGISLLPNFSESGKLRGTRISLNIRGGTLRKHIENKRYRCNILIRFSNPPYMRNLRRSVFVKLVLCTLLQCNHWETVKYPVEVHTMYASCTISYTILFSLSDVASVIANISRKYGVNRRIFDINRINLYAIKW